jgi:hypothetical protein
MPKISIEKTSKHSAAETFSKIKSFLSDDKDLRKLDSNYQCQFDEKTFSGTAKGRQFEAILKISEGAPTRVLLEINLPLLLSTFKSYVEKTLHHKLDSFLG